MQQQVVATGDDLAPRAADYPCPAGQPGSDGHVAVAGEQRRDQREQGVQVCRQIDIHIGEHVRVVRQPDGSQCPAAAWLLQPDGANQVELARQGERDGPGPVGTAVVGDGDPRSERKAGPEVRLDPAHARAEVTFLVAYRDDNLHLGRFPAAGRQRAGLLEESFSRCHGPTLGDHAPPGLCRSSEPPMKATQANRAMIVEDSAGQGMQILRAHDMHGGFSDWAAPCARHQAGQTGRRPTAQGSPR